MKPYLFVIVLALATSCSATVSNPVEEHPLEKTDQANVEILGSASLGANHYTIEYGHRYQISLDAATERKVLRFSNVKEPFYIEGLVSQTGHASSYWVMPPSTEYEYPKIWERRTDYVELPEDANVFTHDPNIAQIRGWKPNYNDALIATGQAIEIYTHHANANVEFALENCDRNSLCAGVNEFQLSEGSKLELPIENINHINPVVFEGSGTYYVRGVLDDLGWPFDLRIVPNPQTGETKIWLKSLHLFVDDHDEGHPIEIDWEEAVFGKNIMLTLNDSLVIENAEENGPVDVRITVDPRRVCRYGSPCEPGLFCQRIYDHNDYKEGVCIYADDIEGE